MLIDQKIQIEYKQFLVIIYGLIENGFIHIKKKLQYQNTNYQLIIIISQILKTIEMGGVVEQIKYLLNLHLLEIF